MIDYVVLSLGELLREGYKEKIEDAYKKFFCSRETDLENFLICKSTEYDNIGFGKTYLIIDKDKLIGQLGRSDTYSSQDISGETILNECYHAISKAAKAVCGRVVVLECREWIFEKFYKQQGFKMFYKEQTKEQLYTLYKRINFEEYWPVECNEIRD